MFKLKKPGSVDSGFFVAYKIMLCKYFMKLII